MWELSNSWKYTSFFLVTRILRVKDPNFPFKRELENPTEPQNKDDNSVLVTLVYGRCNEGPGA